MDKWRVKIISRVLDAVKLNFPATIQFIEDCLEQDCSKKKTKNNSGSGNFSFYMPRSKKLPGFKAETFSLLLAKYAKSYSMKLNSLSHDIYFCVI